MQSSTQGFDMAVLASDQTLNSGVVSHADDDKLTRWAAFVRNLEIYIPVVGLVLIAFFCFIGPMILPVPNPNIGNANIVMATPFTHGTLFGTDALGNDVLSRVLYGGRVSLVVGVASQLIGLVLGSTIGMVATFKGGLTESIVMRLMDMLIAFPALVIAITITAYLGASEIHVIWAISYFSIPAFARFSRAQVLRLRELDFINAARLYTSKDRWIVIRHLAPNVVPNLLTFLCLGTAFAIITEAGLSFLGLGIPPPAPSWGNIIAAGESTLAVDPYLVIIPGACLFITVLFLNLLGDALRSRISTR
jgi:peptide/nickel transport system permease protein